MVVRVAERARRAGAARVVVATDDVRIKAAVEAHGIAACLTARRPRDRHRPSGGGRAAARTADDAIVVNVQGDEPLLSPALIRAVADLLAAHPDAAIATACHPITDPAEAFNPNVVKVVLDARGYALYFSRATIPWARDAFAGGRDAVPAGSAALPALRALCVPRPLPPRVSDARPGADRALRGAGAAARAVARLPDRRRDHRGHAGARGGHARGPRARARACSPRAKLDPAQLTDRRIADRIARGLRCRGVAAGGEAGAGLHPRIVTRRWLICTTIRNHATDTSRPAGRRQRHAGRLHHAGLRASRRSPRATCCAPRSPRARRWASPRRR